MMRFRYSDTMSNMHKSLSLAAALWSVVVFNSSWTQAQETPVERGKTSEAGTEGEKSTSVDVELKELKHRVAELEAARASDKSNTENKHIEDTQKIEALTLRVEDQGNTIAELETAQIEKMEEEQRELKIYGFMDIRWYKFIFYQDEGNFLEGLVNDHNTFIVSHWNMFVDRQISDSFRALGEVRFLFHPQGQTLSYADPYGTPYERMNTTAADDPDGFTFNWGGIFIEQAWIEYKLNDYFGVKAGKYLTPFSMWNLDHGPTVVVPIALPYLITGGLLPNAQTGIYAFGRAFPSGKTSINYGLTFSNGRGPTAEFYDLDDNKAIGLNLGFSYDGPVKLDVGTYLFMGDYTDIEVRFISYDPVNADEVVTVWYKEKAVSANVKLEWADFLLQGEYVRGLVRFQDGKRIHVRNSELYEPDFVQQAAYALVAYRLPFEDVNIRPYFMYEYMQPANWAETAQGHIYGGGINWRINPYVVLKVDFHHVNSKEEAGQLSKDHHIVNTQLAVTY